jgi:hypothetical protein
MARDTLSTAIVLPLVTLVLFLAALFIGADSNFMVVALVWLALAIPAWWLLLSGGRLLAFQVFRALAIGIPALAFGGCALQSQVTPHDGWAQPSLELLAFGVELSALVLFGSLAVIYAEPRDLNGRLGRRVGLATICVLFAFLGAVVGRAVVTHAAFDVISCGVVAVCAGMSLAALTAFAIDTRGEGLFDEGRPL